MYTLLPEQQIKNLQKEYHIRVVILLLFCLSAAIWIGVGSLLPSYIISVVQETAAQNRVHEIQRVTQASSSASIGTEVAASNADILLIKNAQDNVIFSSIIEDIANHRSTGITVTGIQIAHAPVDGAPNQTSIALSGNADTRDDLAAFERVLAADTEFTNVVLPISSLAKGRDIDFSISMTGIN